METHCEYVRGLVENGGPAPSDYDCIDKLLAEVHDHREKGFLSKSDVDQLRAAFGDALSPSTLQGLAYCKPHGYAGDFEMIDSIYQERISPEAQFQNWDRYYQQHPVARAVRNRKIYFHRLLDRHYSRRRPLRVLNVAAGPGRCIFEWFSANREAEVVIQFLESDPKAIFYAAELNEAFLDRLSFTQVNIIRYNPAKKFDLVWAAGIFDYCSDATFREMLQRLYAAVAPAGELVIGNFSDANPSRAFMEVLADWHLRHRSIDELISHATSCGIPRSSMEESIGEEGINLFLHIHR